MSRTDPRSQPMQRVGPEVARILIASIRKAEPLDAAGMAWTMVCGSAVAPRTRAVDFRGNVLYVQVPDSGWRRELQALAPQYLVELNRVLAVRVQRIEFQVAAG